MPIFDAGDRDDSQKSSPRKIPVAGSVFLKVLTFMNEVD